MLVYDKNIKLVDYVFWISFIFFSNPGGILKALGEKSGDGGLNVTDILFFVMCMCFVYVFDVNKFYLDNTFRKVVKYLIIFLIYYLIVFSFFIPLLKNNPYYEFFKTYIKIRHAIIGMVLMIFVYHFYQRSYPIFFKVLLYSSIAVLSIFMISLLIGVDILPVNRVDRRFIETKRLALSHYGIMHILIPMGVVALIFKMNIKFKRLIIIGFVLMFMAWVLAIFRRNIFGTFLYLFVALALYNFINRKAFISITTIFRIGFYSVLTVLIIQFTFPKYVEAGVAAYEETVYVIKYGKSTTGKEDSRLGLGKTFIQNLILENYVFGTGFDNRWRSKMDENSAKYEATDYPFLAAIAQFGIVGLLFFAPLYVILIRSLVYDIKYLRKRLINYQSFEMYVVVLFIVYFIYDLMKYMDWFIMLSASSDIKWGTFYAMYFAARNEMYYQEKMAMRKREEMGSLGINLSL